MNADRDGSEAPQDRPRATETGADAPDTPAQGVGAERAAERRTAQPVQTATDAQVEAAREVWLRRGRMGWTFSESTQRMADAVVAADVRPPRVVGEGPAELRAAGYWRLYREAQTKAERAWDERDALRAEVERLRRYAPSPEFQPLLEASSLGSADVLALRDTVPDDVARTIVMLARQMERAEAAEAKVAELTDAIRKTRSFHGNSIDPSECIECEDHHMPCRSATLLDAALSGGSDQPTDMMVSPQCAKCGDLRGGQPGHETSECRWNGDAPVTDSSAPDVSGTDEARWVNLDDPSLAEGWAHPTPSSKSHFFREGRSLCGRHRIEPHTRIAGRIEELAADDCGTCDRIAMAELAERPTEGEEGAL